LNDVLVCVLAVYRAFNETDVWNGWLSQYNAGLVLSQQFAAVQLVLYFSMFSSLSLPFCHYLSLSPSISHICPSVLPYLCYLTSPVFLSGIS